MQETDYKELFTTLGKAVETCGTHSITKNLKELIISSREVGETEYAILSICAREKGISIEELKKGAKYAEYRRVVYCLLKNHTKNSIRKIGMEIFRLNSHGIVFQAVKYYKELNLKIKADKEFKELYDKLEQKIKTETTKTI